MSNEPNNDYEWKPDCHLGCTYAGAPGGRTYTWSNHDFYARQFYEAVRDFYTDVWYNIKYYRTDPNYCNNIDPQRCHVLQYMSLRQPPMAPIERNMNEGSSPYYVLQPMIDRYGTFTYNLYPSPRRHTDPNHPGFLVNYTWQFFTDNMKYRIAHGTLGTYIQEFGWDPADLGMCQGGNAGTYISLYNENHQWSAVDPINRTPRCDTADHRSHIFATDITQFLSDQSNRHYAYEVAPYHIRGAPVRGSENDGLDAQGNVLTWLRDYQRTSPNP